VRGVNIGTGFLPLADCPAADDDGDGLVRIDETLRAVGAGLSGCPAAPAPTPTASPAPPASPSPPCLSIAGRWILHERGSMTCTSTKITGEQTASIEGDEEIKISQNGCEVKYTAPSVNLVRSGTIEGALVALSGPLLKSNSDFTYYENRVVLRGFAAADRIELETNGSARGDITSGGEFQCAGFSIAVFTRPN
jgi:hypothetical protein